MHRCRTETFANLVEELVRLPLVSENTGTLELIVVHLRIRILEVIY